MHTPLLLSQDDLLNYFRQGEKPASAWRVGNEHELFVLDSQTLERLPYERIRNLLEDIQQTGEWSPVLEQGNLIGLTQGRTNISLEPGGQIELSTAPHVTLHDMVEEIEAYHDVLRHLQDKHHCVFLALGLDPFATPETAPWMPKERYRIMKSYMPKKGRYGLDMMSCTATVQVNLDYSSEDDMRRKLRVALAVQPFISAFFVASPVRAQKATGWASFRQHIWTDTDPDRTGIPSALFQSAVGYADYRDYALNVPMYCIKRAELLPATSWTFAEYREGLGPGQPCTQDDWAYHLSTLFPDVRLKQYLEMRGTDSVPSPLMYGLAALWVGLLYDAHNLELIVRQVQDWTLEEVMSLRQHVAQYGWHGHDFRGKPVQEWCKELLHQAHDGLERRARLKNGQSESVYLGSLANLILSGETIADSLLKDIRFLDEENLKCEFLKLYLI